ncbi:MAG: DUF2185 domain-containing protein [Planctomycetota bacterium]
MDKDYKLSADQIEELVPDMGGCFATDRILVDGEPVGYMYREEPGFPEDSGWRFVAGDETDDYMNDATNLGIYAVNTVANYDRSIIPFLIAPTGSAYARDADSGRWAEVRD